MCTASAAAQAAESHLHVSGFCFVLVGTETCTGTVSSDAQWKQKGAISIILGPGTILSLEVDSVVNLL